MMSIPFTRTTLGDEEKIAISKVIDSGWVVMGERTAEFEEKFAQYVGSQYAVFVDSGTAALFLSLAYWKMMMPKIKKVAIPSLTFTSTAEVVVHNHLTPVFVDVNRKTYCMEHHVGADIAIPVHLMGNVANIPASIYDSAHRIQRGDLPGSKALWCYSFYATKNLTTINGGMIATNDSIAYEWLKKARDHGISKGTTERYKKGEWEYSIDFVGYRLKADDVRAAIGLVQLDKLDENNRKRDNIVKAYNSLLALQNTGNHLYPILAENKASLVKFLATRGIQASVHFLPLHKMPAYAKWSVRNFYDSVENTAGYQYISLPNTDYLGDHLVSLPLYPQMTEKEIKYVANVVLESNFLIK